MKTINQIALGAALILGGFAMTSCSESNTDFLGSWTSATPETVVPAIDGAVAATEVTTFDFSAGTDKASGPVKLTKDYTVTLPADSLGNPVSYTVKASIEGTWTREEKSDDDFILAFDQNSLDVAGVDAPELGPVTANFLGTIGDFTKIEDVKVLKDTNIMKFETDHPDRHFTFIKAK